ncbi:MAG: hypothetical protein LBG88_03990 [Christensenellaceae bacterium]|jgi:hypothetical protein|nr:hypothetical protein [Christensenellaceae bacterium]
MEFLKKNYMKLITATMLLIGSVFALIALITYKADYTGLGALSGAGDTDKTYAVGFMLTFLSVLSFMVLSIVVIVMGMFETTRKYKNWVMLGTAGLTTILMIVAISCTIASDTYTQITDMMSKDNAIAMLTDGAITKYSQIPAGVTGDAMREGAKSITKMASYMFFSRVFELVSFLVLTGLVPLCFAAKKIMKVCCKGTKPATVAPAAVEAKPATTKTK